MFPPPTISSSRSVQVSGRKCQRSTQTIDSGGPCWLEAPWLPTVLNMLIGVPRWCPVIKDLIMDASVGQALKGLPCLLLPFGYTVMCVMQTGILFLSLSGICGST